jgi:uncharacterized protein
MSNNALSGRWALVTGASSGLGVDFAHQLAALGCHLILVARREERLNAVAEQVRGQRGVQVETVIMDLSLPDAPQQLYDRLKANNRQVDVLINNAGFGLYGEFIKLDWEREQNMLQLDIMTVVHMTKLFARDMVARNFGYILQVSSIGAYQPSPLYATYSAAKSFVLNFSEAVNYELRRTNVRISVVSPGITKTEFLQVSGQNATLYQRMVMMTSDEVVRAALNAMLKGRPSIVPGILNALMVWTNRLMPRRVATMIGYRLMENTA